MVQTWVARRHGQRALQTGGSVPAAFPPPPPPPRVAHCPRLCSPVSAGPRKEIRKLYSQNFTSDTSCAGSAECLFFNACRYPTVQLRHCFPVVRVKPSPTTGEGSAAPTSDSGQKARHQRLQAAGCKAGVLWPVWVQLFPNTGHNSEKSIT